MASSSMTELLNRLSLNRLDANLGWTLKEWESRYAGVSLNQGIVLALAEDRRYLAGAKPVSSLIKRSLAPGVYLLSSSDRTEAIKALKKAGVDIIAQPPGPAFTSYTQSKYLSAFPFLRFNGEGENAAPSAGGNRPVRKTIAASRRKEEPASQSEAGAVLDNFLRILEKMKLTKQEKEELRARIERRLVLSEAQLAGTYLRYEKLEARGLDYAGKSLIAKQAMAAGSLVEVSWPGAEGKINRAIGRVQALEKKEGESILVMKDTEYEEPGDFFKIPLGKISLLRRIKQSIFGE
jgi:hypothetical protein